MEVMELHAAADPVFDLHRSPIAIHIWAYREIALFEHRRTRYVRSNSLSMAEARTHRRSDHGAYTPKVLGPCSGHRRVLGHAAFGAGADLPGTAGTPARRLPAG